ncbi:hypothetical protein WJX81_006522 [Elliptochloris bilobata]|uniref:Uncharacterized protein n=1 Tax=Elliptochloris bilobata TaxID=381761 RepID=A0AAW1QYC0_9CHLO
MGVGHETGYLPGDWLPRSRRRPMKVFGLMLREDCTDRALREALARDSSRHAARDDQDLESMGSLLRCTSSEHADLAPNGRVALRDAEGAAERAGAWEAGSFWRGSEESEAMRAASSAHAEQHLGADMELLLQVQHETDQGEQHGMLETMGSSQLPAELWAAAALEEDGTQYL